MFWVRAFIVLLLLGCASHAQTNPGFIDGAPLCANYPNTNCSSNTPFNPLSLNQAFANKQDAISGTPSAGYVPVGTGAAATWGNSFPGQYTFGSAGGNIDIEASIVSTNTFGKTNEALRLFAPTRSGTATGGSTRLIDVQDQSETVTLNNAGVTVDTLFVYHNFGDSAANRTGLNVSLQNTAAGTHTVVGQTGNYYLGSITTTTAAFSGTTAQFLGVGGIAKTASSVNVGFLEAAEFDVALGSGATATRKQALVLVSGYTSTASDLAHGSSVDEALGIVASASGDVGFNCGICFGLPSNYWPITIGGTMIGTYATVNGMTATYGVDLNAVTFSQCAFRSSGFCVASLGSLQISGANAGVAIFARDSSGSYQWYSTTNSALNLFNGGNIVSISNVGALTLSAGITSTLPTSAGAGGIFVCVDTSGVFYKKATCP